jgi:4-oxalocrotonate tautomerase family enzyme
MPTLQIHLAQGHDVAEKAALIAAMTRATVDALTVAPESVRVIIEDYAPVDHGAAGEPLTHRPASRLDAPSPIVFALLIAGRTETQKAALIAQIDDACNAVLGTTREPSRVFIKDIPNTDFGLAGQTAKALGR